MDAFRVIWNAILATETNIVALLFFWIIMANARARRSKVVKDHLKLARERVEAVEELEHGYHNTPPNHYDANRYLCEALGYVALSRWSSADAGRCRESILMKALERFGGSFFGVFIAEIDTPQ